MRNMKVLFAYDGSRCADAALQDLKSAGLPTGADCLVLTVADVWLPPGDGERIDSLSPELRARILAMYETARLKLADAGAIAKHGAETIASILPHWKVSSEALGDSPAWGILRRADTWMPDLISMGAHGTSAVGRILMGSVSRKVMNQAACSVRIARGCLAKEDTPIRLIIGFDGSPDAITAVRAVARRVWPEGTQVRLITAIDDTLRTAIAARILKLDSYSGETLDHHVWLSRMAETAADGLRAAHLNVTCFLKEGDPKHVLLDAAEEWQADSIFLGATGLRGLRRLLLGSVSSGVGAAAGCSVEIVR